MNEYEKREDEAYRRMLMAEAAWRVAMGDSAWADGQRFGLAKMHWRQAGRVYGEAMGRGATE